MLLQEFLLISGDSLARVGLHIRVSSFEPRLFFAFRREDGPVGAIATHIDAILGRGEPDALSKIRVSPECRFGEMRAQESPFVRFGVEVSQEDDFTVKLPQEEFAKNLKPLISSPTLWVSRWWIASPAVIKLRDGKMGELLSLATVSTPDFWAGAERIAFRANSLQGSYVCRINEQVW